MLPDCSCASCGYAQTSAPRGAASFPPTARKFSRAKLLLLVWVGLFVAGMFAISYTRSGQQVAFGTSNTAPAQSAPVQH